MANPALNEKTWNRISDTSTVEVMTIQGAINKAGILIMLAIGGAYLGWNLQSGLIMMASLVGALILSLVIIFKPTTASYLSQPYAVIEGLLLGTISSVYAAKFPGIVSNALFGTIGCFVIMLALYRLRIIQVTEKFRMVLLAATGAIALTYIADFIMGYFGTSIPMIHQSSTVGIIFSVAVVGVAAFNLMLDFDMIEQTEARKAPKYMEWYAGFALLVTLVWLYLEILRLLSKLNKK